MFIHVDDKQQPLIASFEYFPSYDLLEETRSRQLVYWRFLIAAAKKRPKFIENDTTQHMNRKAL